MVTECELILSVARFRASMLFEAFYSTDGHVGRLCFGTDMDLKKNTLTSADSESASSAFKREPLNSPSFLLS